MSDIEVFLRDLFMATRARAARRLLDAGDPRAPARREGRARRGRRGRRRRPCAANADAHTTYEEDDDDETTTTTSTATTAARAPPPPARARAACCSLATALASATYHEAGGLRASLRSSRRALAASRRPWARSTTAAPPTPTAWAATTRRAAGAGGGGGRWWGGGGGGGAAQRERRASTAAAARGRGRGVKDSSSEPRAHQRAQSRHGAAPRAALRHRRRRAARASSRRPTARSCARPSRAPGTSRSAAPGLARWKHRWCAPAAARDTPHARATLCSHADASLSPPAPQVRAARRDVFIHEEDAVDDSTLGCRRSCRRAPRRRDADPARRLVLVVLERHQRVHLRLPSGDADGSTRADITALAEWKEAIGAARARAAGGRAVRLAAPGRARAVRRCQIIKWKRECCRRCRGRACPPKGWVRSRGAGPGARRAPGVGVSDPVCTHKMRGGRSSRGNRAPARDRNPGPGLGGCSACQYVDWSRHR